MRRIQLLAIPVLLAISACATAPPIADKRTMAQEVFQLSGGLEDLRVMARFAPALADVDVRQQCLDGLGRNPNPLGATVCDMLDSAVRGVRSGQGGLSQALDAQITRMESRAVDAMVETYSPGELAAMRRYYSSPEGRSIVAKRQEYLTRLFSGK